MLTYARERQNPLHRREPGFIFVWQIEKSQLDLKKTYVLVIEIVVMVFNKDISQFVYRHVC